MSDYFFNAIKKDIRMIQGDTCSFGFQIQGLQGQRPNNIIFSVKEKVEDEEALFTLSLNDNIDFRSYDSDKDVLTYGVRIPPLKTHVLELGRYFYDLQAQVNADIITLMIGRLTLEYQITNGTVEPVPTYENGDNIGYPQADISESTIKLYHELPISNIATQINNINSSEDSYTTAQMSGALADIKDDITDISDAINAITGGSSEIALANIAGVISNQLGLYYENGTEVLY